MSSNLRSEIWNEWLDAKMNLRYYERLRQRFHRRDQWMKIAIALSSSTSVAGWALWSDIKPIWQLFSSITTVLAIVSPFLNYTKLIGLLGDLRGQWVRAESLWQRLWIRVNDTQGASSEEFDKVKDFEVTIGEKESDVPIDNDLLEECQQAVIKSLKPST